MPGRFLLLGCVLCLGCRDAVEIADEPVPSAVNTDFARLPEILTGVQKSGELLLYEGLPSQSRRVVN